MNICDADKIILRFYNQINGDTFTRYKSWEWCHKAFLNKRDEYRKCRKQNEKDEIIDYLSLHLAFYLASWGMYRGSSFLLQRDYKTHKDVVRLILGTSCEKIWDYNPSNNNDTNEVADCIFGEDGLYTKISKCYQNENSAVTYEEDTEKDSVVATDTLVTKILMGTFACMPAFDRFLKAGIAYYKKVNENLELKLTQNANNKKTFEALAAIANDIESKQNELKQKLKYDDQPYPPMKLLDMYFWEIGYELDLLARLKNCKKNDKQGKIADKLVAATQRLIPEKTINNIDGAINAINDLIER